MEEGSSVEVSGMPEQWPGICWDLFAVWSVPNRLRLAEIFCFEALLDKLFSGLVLQNAAAALLVATLLTGNLVN